MTTPNGNPAPLARVHVTHKPGSRKLTAFPLLVRSTRHFGDDRVRTEDGRATAEEIASAHAAAPDLDMDALAAQFGTTGEHVRQAIEYATAEGIG